MKEKKNSKRKLDYKTCFFVAVTIISVILCFLVVLFVPRIIYDIENYHMINIAMAVFFVGIFIGIANLYATLFLGNKEGEEEHRSIRMSYFAGITTMLITAIIIALVRTFFLLQSVS